MTVNGLIQNWIFDVLEELLEKLDRLAKEEGSYYGERDVDGVYLGHTAMLVVFIHKGIIIMNQHCNVVRSVSLSVRGSYMATVISRLEWRMVIWVVFLMV